MKGSVSSGLPLPSAKLECRCGCDTCDCEGTWEKGRRVCLNRRCRYFLVTHRSFSFKEVSAIWFLRDRQLSEFAETLVIYWDGLAICNSSVAARGRSIYHSLINRQCKGDETHFGKYMKAYCNFSYM